MQPVHKLHEVRRKLAYLLRGLDTYAGQSLNKIGRFVWIAHCLGGGVSEGNGCLLSVHLSNQVVEVVWHETFYLLPEDVYTPLQLHAHQQVSNTTSMHLL